jgi:hypothetical protein
MRLILGLLFAGLAISQVRTVGLEPGLQFGVVPPTLSLCQFGEYQRTALDTAYDKGCTNFTKNVDTLLTNGSLNFETWTFFPFSKVQQFQVKLNGGQTGYVFTFWKTAPRVAMNVADPNFLAYTFDTYIPTLLLPHVKSSQPVHIAIDGFSTDYVFIGSINTGSFTTGHWDPNYPQTPSAWAAAWATFFDYAKTHCPNVRLLPHIGNMNTPDWSYFKSIYASVPSIEHELIPIGSVAAYSTYSKLQLYNKIVNLSWFANSAPPVFAGDPATRILSWGTTLDNGDIHSALALYSMVKGSNSFFALLDAQGRNAVDPSTWSNTSKALGVPASLPTAIVGSGATSLLSRAYPNGMAYFNIGAGTQTVTLPPGNTYTDWTGNVVRSTTLTSGKGDVFLLRTP